MLEKLQVLLPTLVVATCQVLPLSALTYTVSPLARLALKVPLKVWAAVLVLKSVLLLPLAAVSALIKAVAMVVLGALVSRVKLSAVGALLLPAKSCWRTHTV